MFHATNRSFAVVSLCLATTVLAFPGARAGFEDSARLTAESLVLENLIGEIRVEGGSGPEFEVHIEVRGKDASREAIRIEKHEGSVARVAVRFPVDRENHYVYPRLGSESTTMFEADSTDRGWLARVLGFVTGDRIRVRGSGSGMEVWADAVVKVPTGKSLEVRHGVGDVVVRGIEGDLAIHVRSGSIEATSLGGTATLSTGSGNVRIDGAQADLHIDTGSGGVEVSGATGSEVRIDTGSGSVETESVRCETLDINTGSGGVRASAIDARRVLIDTGSGSVRLQLDAMGDGRFDIDTGSGSIILSLPPEASAQVAAETGSGGIQVSLADAEYLRRDSDEVVFHVGAGAARVRLDTGSGVIRIE